MKKAQVSVDFIIVLSMVFVIFLVVFVTASRRNTEVVSAGSRLYAKAICEKVATQLNTVLLAGDGIQKTIELPETLKDNSYYVVNIYPISHIVEVRWLYGTEIRQYSCPILYGSLTGNLTGITNDFTISNEGNESDVDLTQIYAECAAGCIDQGYSDGVCRHHGQQDCFDHGEVPAKGNVHATCIVVGAAQCCCTP